MSLLKDVLASHDASVIPLDARQADYSRVSLKLVYFSQRSNARRVRNSRHNFTKENTDKSRKLHLNRKT